MISRQNGVSNLGLVTVKKALMASLHFASTSISAVVQASDSHMTIIAYTQTQQLCLWPQRLRQDAMAFPTKSGIESDCQQLEQYFLKLKTDNSMLDASLNVSTSQLMQPKREVSCLIIAQNVGQTDT